MDENDEYLQDLLKTTGKTNLGDYFLKHIKEKEEK